MHEKAEVAALVDKAVGLVRQHLEKAPDPMLSFVPREQFLLYLSNLQQMAEYLTADELPPDRKRYYGMADTILDDWPVTFVGEAIVNAERAWRDL
jgi:hypothetical protein